MFRPSHMESKNAIEMDELNTMISVVTLTKLSGFGD